MFLGESLGKRKCFNDGKHNISHICIDFHDRETVHAQENYRVSKKYTKLIRHNLRPIKLINNTYNYSTQFKLNFESSFVGIHQVLRETWLFGHEFQARNFGQFGIFWVSNLSTNYS